MLSMLSTQFSYDECNVFYEVAEREQCKTVKRFKRVWHSGCARPRVTVKITAR